MRTPAFLVLAALICLGLPTVQGAPAKPGSPKPAPAAAKAKDDGAKTDEIVLPGMVTKRPAGGYVSLDVVGTNWVLRFYDKDKTPVAPDCTRASVRWQPKQKPRQMTSVLTPAGDGLMLKGDKVVQPPYVFKAYVSLFGEGETVLESFQVDYRDDGIPPSGN
jgi:hypothetical protein